MPCALAHVCFPIRSSVECLADAFRMHSHDCIDQSSYAHHFCLMPIAIPVYRMQAQCPTSLIPAIPPLRSPGLPRFGRSCPHPAEKPKLMPRQYPSLAPFGTNHPHTTLSIPVETPYVPAHAAPGEFRIQYSSNIDPTGKANRGEGQGGHTASPVAAAVAASKCRCRGGPWGQPWRSVGAPARRSGGRGGAVGACRHFLIAHGGRGGAVAVPWRHFLRGCLPHAG
jgi:hypothetical protein